MLAKVSVPEREESDSPPTVSCLRSLLLAVFLLFYSTEAAVCQRDCPNPNSNEKMKGMKGLTKKNASLGWSETRCILVFLFCLVCFQSPAEDPLFKDSDPSVSHIPTFESPSSPQHSCSVYINALRERIDNSGVQLMAICPSVSINNIINIRNK